MIEQVFEFFSGVGQVWALFFVSVVPFIELRGAIPFGILALNMPWYQAFLLSFAANCLPIPVVYFLTRPLFAYLRKTKLFSGFIDRFEAKMMKKSEKVTKYKIIGTFPFCRHSASRHGRIFRQRDRGASRYALQKGFRFDCLKACLSPALSLRLCPSAVLWL